VFDVNCFIISILNFNTSGCLQSNSNTRELLESKLHTIQGVRWDKGGTGPADDEVMRVLNQDQDSSFIKRSYQHFKVALSVIRCCTKFTSSILRAITNRTTTWAGVRVRMFGRILVGKTEEELA